MEVNDQNATLASQLTAQALRDQQPVSPRAGGPVTPADRSTLGGRDAEQSANNPRSSLVRVQGGRSADELGLSSEEELDAARENVSRLTDREAPLGRTSSRVITQNVPLGQIVDIRV